MHLEDLPDRVHIEALREALWRPKSRAAVLVGAGMSRNADRLSAAVKEFPVWWQIGNELKKALGPRDASDDALRLGQMYENTYGRARLDDLLLELIPDGKYEPGDLHKRLLRLPWADLFTTNYDTLLERTRSSVPERKYDAVEVPADLTRAERPRIVKLHGSFPARRPFIFTEEDYRRYPTEFAPFVNLVRQSAMENVLCLVGFSGNDPNFLQWAGWVRDQFGATAPKMYHCGVLDLTTPQRSYYRHMQVIPVDLGPLFSERHWGAQRHGAALAWLIDSLRAGEPVNRAQWPNIKAPVRTISLAQGSPEPLPPEEVPVFPAQPALRLGEPDLETLKQLLSRWKSERLCYPGWSVCPESARVELGDVTISWFAHFEDPAGVQFLNLQALPERADALREIAWRAETALLPLPDTLPPLIGKTLEAINPRPRLIDLRDAILTPDAMTHGFNPDHMTEVWVALAFTLVRHAWQFQDMALHERWMGLLRGVAAERSDWNARWWYEKCWHHLMRLEAEQARRAAWEWPEDSSQPFWEAKRAAVLAELGELDKAQELAMNALQRVRLGRDWTRVDYQSLSEESWILVLIQVLVNYAMDLPGPEHEQRERQLRELARDLCNPLDDLRRRERALAEGKAGVRQSRVRGFDPGRMHWNATWVSWQGSEWVLINTLHDGLKLRSKSPGTLAALRRVWRSSPHLALSLAIRAGATEALTEGEGNPLSGLLGRAAIACLSREQVDRLHAWLSSVLPIALTEREQHPDPELRDIHGDRRRIEGTAEVLSRIAFRLSEAQLADLFESTQTMYRSSVCQRELALHRPVERLLNRLLDAATPQQITSWLPALLVFPMPGDSSVEVGHDSHLAEPFCFLDWAKFPKLSRAEGAACSAAVSRLLALVREGMPETRKRASWRLALLALAGALTQGQLDSFVGAIWKGTDGHGYPADVGFMPWVLLKLPERQPGEARRAVARHFLEQAPTMEWVERLQETTSSILEPLDPDRAVPRIVWAPEEARVLLEKLCHVWQKQKSSFGMSGFLGRRRHIGDGVSICRALSTSIAPFLDRGDVQAHTTILALVEELRQHGSAAVSPLPSLLMLGAAESSVVATELHRALFGAHEHNMIDGLSGLLIWTDLSDVKRIDPPPSWLIDALLSCVETGRGLGLNYALSCLAGLLARDQRVLEQRHLETLARALDRIRETVTLEGMRDDGTWDDDLQLNADERLAILREASALAAELAAAHRRRGAAEPDAVAAWRALAVTHPLPEVRRPWRDPPDAPPGPVRTEGPSG